MRLDRRGVGLVAVIGGLMLAVLAGLDGPRRVIPLYDGVVPISPYVWLSPPPGQNGGATGVTDTLPVAGGQSPLVAVHTSEVPPQAQLVAGPGALDLPAGTTSITVSIMPVPPAVPPADGQVAGNVYRISVRTQSGSPVLARAQAEVTLSLRAPSTITPSWFEQYAGGTWNVLESAQAGFPFTYETTGLTSFGEFALVGHGASSGPLDVIGGVLAAAVAVVIVVALGVSVVALSRRRRRGPTIRR